MIVEHYLSNHSNVFMAINQLPADVGYYEAIENYHKNGCPKFSKTIHYDLEHRYPFDKSGVPYVQSSWWVRQFLNVIDEYDEIWSFQIENYGFYKYHGLQDKFRFVPLRYTTSLKKYQSDKSWDERPYDAEFVGVTHSLDAWVIGKVRGDILANLCGGTIWHNQFTFMNYMTGKTDIKFDIKGNSKVSLDIPRLDRPQTINTARIFESLCVGTPVVCLDPYNCTEVQYFPDDVYVKHDVLPDICPPENLLNFVMTKRPCGLEVANRYKDLTYSDATYNKYRESLIAEYEANTGIKIPDLVLQID